MLLRVLKVDARHPLFARRATLLVEELQFIFKLVAAHRERHALSSTSAAAAEVAEDSVSTASPERVPLADPRIVERFSAATAATAAATSTSDSALSTEVARRTIEGDCPVCYEPLLAASTTSAAAHDHDVAIAWCRFGCGHNFHAACLIKWCDAQAHTQRAQSCVLCRASVLPSAVKLRRLNFGALVARIAREGAPPRARSLSRSHSRSTSRSRSKKRK